MNDFFIPYIQAAVPRLLCQLDLQPGSKTEGSFDRAYWHMRKVEFSSASLQQGHLVLAFLYRNSFENNTLYGLESILQSALASLSFTARIQHPDGSMDEWYPQERGWAGPTGYVLYSVCLATRWLDDKIYPELRRKLTHFAAGAVKHLLDFEETDVLSNHQAMALLAIESAKKVFGVDVDLKKQSQLHHRFLSGFSPEGWSLEYDGCDPGYQSANLSFLSRLHQISGSDEIRQICLRQLSFLKNFVFPDGSFAGPMGTRGTQNVFHFGFEYWAQQGNAEAAYLAHMTRQGLRAGTLLKPMDQEDHYLIYRLVEFVECAALQKIDFAQTISFIQSETEYLPDCGILRISTPQFFGQLNLKKGGTGKIFDLLNSRFVFVDSGYFGKTKKGLEITTAFANTAAKVEILNNEFVIYKDSNLFKKPVFSPLTYVLFRIFLLFVRNSRLARFLKSRIRSMTMTSFQTSNKLYLKRSITIGEQIFIKDELKVSSQFLELGRFIDRPARTVPQSNYVTVDSASWNRCEIMSQSQINILNSTGELTLRPL